MPEINFDGIVGPTHNYAGLSYGNVASMTNRLGASNPRQAALEGIAKMRRLAALGIPQAVLPPHERPHLATLRRLGYSGSDADVLYRVSKDDPVLLAAVCSSSAMWTANAATVSPAADTADGRVHFTPANLLTQFHRSIEAPFTSDVLRRVFADESRFAHHPPLPASTHFADEGAANHTRLCGDDPERPGMELFVFGRRGLDPLDAATTKFPARQTAEACAAIARLHGLDERVAMMLRQNPAAIDAGAFHNDVVAVGHRHVLLVHELAFAQGIGDIDAIRTRFAEVCGSELVAIVIGETELPLTMAIRTYLFNSQIVTVTDGSIALVAPVECRDDEIARRTIEAVVADAANPIAAVHYVDVRQSMRNGGGPACLRLRVTLTDAEHAATRSGVFFGDPLAIRLEAWVEQHYRDHLAVADLADPRLLEETRMALDQLTSILDLGSIYPFQGPSTGN